MATKMQTIGDGGVVLNDSNYEDWKFIVAAKLRGKGLWKCMDAAAQSTDAEKQKATSMIVKHVGTNMIHIIRHCNLDQPDVLWQTIERHFIHLTGVDKQLLLVEISNLRMSGKLSLTTFSKMVDELRTLHLRVEVAGEPQSEAAKISQLLVILMQYQEDDLKLVIRDILKRRNLRFSEATDLVKAEIHRIDTEKTFLQPPRSGQEDTEKAALQVERQSEDPDKKYPPKDYKCNRCNRVGQHFHYNCWAKDKKCNKCHKIGHLAHACRKKADIMNDKSSDGQPGSSSSLAQVVKESANVTPSGKQGEMFYRLVPRNTDASSSNLATLQPENVDKSIVNQVKSVRPWIVDSGTTDHIIGDATEGCDFRACQQRLRNQNGTVDLITQTCSVILCPIDEGSLKPVKLEDVLVNPKASANLFSVSKAANCGLLTTFTDGEVFVYREDDGSTVLQGHREGNLYVLDSVECNINEPGKTLYTMLASTGDDGKIVPMIGITGGQFIVPNNPPRNKLEDWHIRMGHINYRTLREMIKNRTLDVEPEVGMLMAPLCVTCSLCNIKRRKFGKKAKYDVTKPGTFLIIDTKGPMEVKSVSGYAYYLLIVCVYSRKYWIEFIKNRTSTEMIFALKSVFIRVERESRYSVTKVHSDNAPEFVSSEFRRFMVDKNISHTTNVFGMPQSGTALAERGIQTITNVTKCFLKEIENVLPNYKKYWAVCAMQATRTVNLWPSNSHSGTEYEGKSRNFVAGCTDKVHTIYPFGAPTIAYKHERKAVKALDDSGMIMMMIGYAPEHRGYELLNLKTKRVYVSRDVKVLVDMKFEKVVRDAKSAPVEKGNGDNERDSSDEEVGNDPHCELREDEESEVDDVNEDFDEETNTSNQDDDYHDNDVGVLVEQLKSNRGNNESDGRVTPPIENQSGAKTSRHGRKVRLPKHLDDSFVFTAASTTMDTPTSYKKAMISDKKEMWSNAMDVEYKALIERNTWELVPRPQHQRVLPSKWVYKIKCNGDGSIERYKARLVVLGFLQTYGIDYTETYASTVRLDLVRLFIWYANQCDLEIEHCDVGNAYLNADLEPNVCVYMSQPEGYVIDKSNPDLVCHLKRPLYGLRQAGNRWEAKRDELLNKLKFKKSILEPSLYYRNQKDILMQEGELIIIIVYVDDFLIIGHKNDCRATIEDIAKIVKFTHEGSVHWFHGMKIFRDKHRGIVELSQMSTIEDIIYSHDMVEAKGVKIPFDALTRAKLSEPVPDGEVRTDLKYRNLIGSLMYVARMTRPDILWHTQFLSRFCQRFSILHWKAATNIVRYLISTKGLCIRYSKVQDVRQPLSLIQGYCDTSHGDDLSDGLSTYGYAFIAGGGYISARVTKHESVCLSTTEAEYCAMTPAAQHACWIRNVFLEVNMIEAGDMAGVSVFTDGRSAFHAATKASTSFTRMKHISLRHHYIREAIRSQQVLLKWIAGSANPADMMTKPLGSVALGIHRGKMMQSTSEDD